VSREGYSRVQWRVATLRGCEHSGFCTPGLMASVSAVNCSKVKAKKLPLFISN
jgi:xanthine dehydrogenase iron-sulfur cluster and FAD-binding subunit A